MKQEADLSPTSVSSWSVEQVGTWSEQELPVLEWKQRAISLGRADAGKLPCAASHLPPAKKMRTRQQLFLRGFV